VRRLSRSSQPTNRQTKFGYSVMMSTSVFNSTTAPVRARNAIFQRQNSAFAVGQSLGSHCVVRSRRISSESRGQGSRNGSTAGYYSNSGPLEATVIATSRLLRLDNLGEETHSLLTFHPPGLTA
jgi:hypothetical protein